jgi:hypothetical protein
MAVFFVVVAGYMYMVGGDKGKETAKEILVSVLAGFLIMLSSYVLLRQINPTLVTFRTIQPPQLTGTYKIPSCSEVGLGTECLDPHGQVAVGDGNGGSTAVQNSGGAIAPVSGGGCSTKDSGGCTRQTIQSGCPKMAERMDDALKVCNHESGGGQVAIASSTDLCLDDGGQKVSFSHGLWQINITDSSQPTFPECDNVLRRGASLPGCAFPFSQTSSGNCVVPLKRCVFPKGRAAYEACRRALSDPVRNTKQACILFNRAAHSSSRGAWQPWPYTEKTVCKIPIWKF